MYDLMKKHVSKSTAKPTSKLSRIQKWKIIKKKSENIRECVNLFCLQWEKSWCSSLLPNLTGCFSFCFMVITGNVLKRQIVNVDCLIKWMYN